MPHEFESRRDRLLEILRGYGRVAVAFSAGVDSTVVAQAAQIACGDKAIAITAVSPSLASGEREVAVQLASQIGIRHQLIETQELSNGDYLKNPPNRCYFCKTELYSRLEGLAARLQFDVIVNGANLDDLGDYRPGMQAAGEHRVCSPLVEAGFTKENVRELARAWQLPNCEKPASPCLSSRLAYGVEVTPERLARVDQAEIWLRGALGLAELRVRHEAHDLARVEVPCDALSRFLDPALRQRVAEKLRALGFKYVTLDLDGFRSGSMNAGVDLVQIVAVRND